MASKEKEIDMYSKIMVPLDGSELAECVLPHLETIARGCQITTVVLVRVVDPGLPPSSFVSGGEFGLRKTDWDQLKKRRQTVAEDYLKELKSQLNYNGAKVESKVFVGRVSETLADYATKNSVDLILIASHGHSGITRWVMGSVADRVLRSACVPVLMIRAPGCVQGI
jgi:nucleotide-binding universal stress UspA family protein